MKNDKPKDGAGRGDQIGFWYRATPGPNGTYTVEIWDRDLVPADLQSEPEGEKR